MIKHFTHFLATCVLLMPVLSLAAHADGATGSAAASSAKPMLTPAQQKAVDARFVRLFAANPDDPLAPPRALTVVRVSTLLAAGANVDARDTNGNTALMMATLWHRIAVVKLLLASGADVNAANSGGDTALIDAPGQTPAEAVADSSQTKSGPGETNADIVQILLAAGASVNAADKQGDTALIDAADVGDADSVRLLLAAKADMSAKNAAGNDALLTALNNDNTDIVKLLLAAGANASSATKNGYTAVMVAMNRGLIDVVRQLLAAGANVNAKGPYGVTALMMAADNGMPQVVKLLLQNGADVHAKDNEGNTALYYTGAPNHLFGGATLASNLQAGRRECARELKAAGESR